MAEPRENCFASAKTFAELQAMYASATSSTNLANAGESALVETHARYVRLSTDFERRNLELGRSLMGIKTNPSFPKNR